MEYAIITRGRHEANHVLMTWPREILEKCHLFCHPGEGAVYRHNYGWCNLLGVHEYRGDNVGQARDYILRRLQHAQNVLFIEDNINLYVRGRLPEKGERNSQDFYPIREDRFSPEVVTRLHQNCFDRIALKLNDEQYGLVGVSARQGNNHVQEAFTDNVRIYGLWGISVAAYFGMAERLSDVVYREDFYIALSLIRAGYKLGCFYEYAFAKHRGVNTPGGCNTYRTQEGTDANAEWMAQEFAPFVSVAEKERQWEGYSGMVKDVRVQWKKMYDYYRKDKQQTELF